MVMRVNLHDFSGHPFQAQLSRNLAQRGHDVLHEYSSQYVTGHGRLEVEPDDPDTLRIESLAASAPMVKYSPIARIRFELAYADAWRRKLERSRHDVVVVCNVPLFALARMRRFFASRRQPWVMWHQDVYSLGIASEASRRLPKPMAAGIRRSVERMERAQVASASAVVAIGDPFLEQYDRWGLSLDGVHVIPNWAPLDELIPGARDNAWARRQNLPAAPIRLMYAGTLGRKHNPLLLLELLDGVRDQGLDAMLIVVSEGVGADDLAEAARGREDVRILGYQPAEDFSDVLASADVMVALLEPDAAQFSVPSKVLSYLSAGRPTIALVPAGNPCAADVAACGGCVAPPSPAGARAGAAWLGALAGPTSAGIVTEGIPSGLVTIGIQARNLASTRFNIDRIGSQFETILAEAASQSHGRGRAPLVTVLAGGGGGVDK
jgi:colanic acid biosynthesis glycosyl transferase WcaI